MKETSEREKIDMIIVSSYLRGEKWQITLLFNPGNMILDFYSLLSFACRFFRNLVHTHTQSSKP